MDKECNHEGKWGSLGSVILNHQGNIMIVHSLFCKKCGDSKMVAKNIPLPAQPKVSVAKMSLGKKPPGQPGRGGGAQGGQRVI